MAASSNARIRQKGYYNQQDLRYFKELYDLAFRRKFDTQEKRTHDDIMDDHQIVLESISSAKNTTYNMNIVRGSIQLDYEEAKPYKFWEYLRVSGNNVFHRFTSFKSKELNNHEVTDCKRLVQDLVIPNSYASVADPRKWIFWDVIAMCDLDGTVYEQGHPEINENCPLMLNIMRSLSDSEYLTKRKKGLFKNERGVRGDFKRTGYAMRSLENGKTEIIFVMEMDIKGNSWISGIGSGVGNVKGMVFDVLRDFAVFFKAISVWTGAFYQTPECKGNQQEIELLKSQKLNQGVRSDAEETKEEKEEWAKMDEITIPFDEEKTTVEITVAVGKIAKIVTAAVGAMSSSGALAPALVKSLSDCVVTAGWTQECSKKKVTKHLGDGDTYIFVELTKSVKISLKGITGFRTEYSKIKGSIKCMYLEAGNKAASDRLGSMKRVRAAAALNYMNSLSGWHKYT